MYGIYATNDDEMFVMSQDEVFIFLRNASLLNFSVHTDGNKVSIWEPSAGANGKLDEVSVSEYFSSFEEDGYIIRPISSHKER
ncbi:hypothetical protein JCM10914A_56060 [Paenibacillus sp. JCM 10914]|uniref:hypothetical protein n=1 Tax=Paenibacillus sp. JCM 10914 TaxID=1236974 RepID=UPI0003CC758A|nr:hypothetical protein [Paenibacillus sp. JCM 10914]GAE09596.1 hypothetical protein JCM10914_5964 [Paenibacillus sp. JCM 10914]